MEFLPCRKARLFLFAGLHLCNNRQHTIHHHARLYKRDRNRQLFLRGAPIGHRGQAAGRQVNSSSGRIGKKYRPCKPYSVS